MMTTRYKKLKIVTFIICIIIDKFPIVFQFFLIQAKRIAFYFHFEDESFKNIQILIWRQESFYIQNL